MDKSFRYENKFVCSNLYASEILSWVALSSFCFSKHYPGRTISNIYYDTFEYAMYADNLDGISKRSKLRYRWYGNSLYPRNGTLELKNRINSYGYKESVKVDLTNNVTSHSSLYKNLTNHANEAWRTIIQYNSLPIILNRYMRSYYISKCRGIRLTLDQRHEVYDQTLSDKINITHKTATTQYMAIELKYDPSSYETVTSKIGDIPLRNSRNSKYVNSVNTIMQ